MQFYSTSPNIFHFNRNASPHIITCAFLTFFPSVLLCTFPLAESGMLLLPGPLVHVLVSSVTSVVSVSLQPHALQPTRLLCPWDSPGKNTGVGSHFLLWGIFPTQWLVPDLPHWQARSLPLVPPGCLSPGSHSCQISVNPACLRF